MARKKQDENLFEQAFEKFEKATQINPEYATAFDGWGIALSCLAKIKQDENLFEQALEKWEKVYEINPKKLYNLSCGYALLGKKEQALHYLEESLKNKTIEIDFVINDDDWKNYLADKDFIDLIDKYR